MQITIVSGGQTGVDRGALDAAIAMGVPCGGWCPEGRMAEDGVISDIYPLTVLPGAGYRQRTRQNIIDSDATVIIYFEYIVARGGTELTLQQCIKANKPYLLIDSAELSAERAAERIASFVQQRHVLRLNVAGPRGGGMPQLHPYTQSAITLMLRQIAGIEV